LDRRAGEALAAIISKTPFEAAPMDDGSFKEQATARGAYSYARAMLAEKRRIEALDGGEKKEEVVG
jgi:hypothetical protein